MSRRLRRGQQSQKEQDDEESAAPVPPKLEEEQKKGRGKAIAEAAQCSPRPKFTRATRGKATGSKEEQADLEDGNEEEEVEAGQKKVAKRKSPSKGQDSAKPALKHKKPTPDPRVQHQKHQQQQQQQQQSVGSALGGAGASGRSLRRSNSGVRGTSSAILETKRTRSVSKTLMQKREDEDEEEEEDEDEAAAEMEWKEAEGNKKGENDDDWYPGNLNAPAKRAKKSSKAAAGGADDAGALSNQSAKIGLAIKGGKNAPVRSGGVPLRGKRAKEALAIAKRASSACNKTELQEAELPKIVPPFTVPVPRKSAILRFHATQHGPAIVTKKPSASPETGAQFANLVIPNSSWHAQDFGQHLAFGSDTLWLDPVNKCRSFSIVLHLTWNGDSKKVCQVYCDDDWNSLTPCFV